MGLTSKYFERFEGYEQLDIKDAKKAFRDGIRIGRKLARSIWRQFPEKPKFSSGRNVVIYIKKIERFDVQPPGEAKMLVERFKDELKWCYLDEMVFEKGFDL